MSRELLPVAGPRETVRGAVRLLRSHPVPLLVAAVAFLVTGVAGVAGPWFVGRIVDHVREGGGTGQVWWDAGAIAVTGVVGGIATLVSVAVLARATEPALADLREEVLDRALHLDAQRLEAAGTGDLTSRVGDDVKRVTQALSELVPLVITSLVTVLVTGAGLFALDWRLGLAGLAAVPMFVVSLRWYLPRSAPYYTREREVVAERAEALVAGVQGAATLRAIGRDEAWLGRINGRSREAVRLSVDVWMLLLRFFARNNRAELVGLLLVLGSGFLLVRADEVTVGQVTAAALLFHRLFNPIGALLVTFDEVQAAGAALARLAGVAGMPSDPSATAIEREPSSGSGADVVVAGVGHAYRPDLPVLQDVTLRIAPGERVAVVGTTGAGKTTLGAIVAGTLAPTTGSVHVAGHDLSDAGRRARLRGRVAVVTQEVHVFAGTVRENLTLAAPDADDTAVLAALEGAGCLPWLRALPDGLDTVVGDDGTRLGPAQAQQLALARLLLQDPLLAVFDEATAEAGSSGARELEVAALQASAGRTSLVIAHRLTQAASADRVVVMEDGRVVEEGTHDELVGAGGRYAGFWAAWVAR